MKRKIIVRLLLLLLPVLFATGFPLTRSEELPEEKIARQLTRQLPRLHLSRRPLDEQVAADALEVFLDSLDYQRSYFLQSDVEQFSESIPELAGQVKKGDLSFADEVFDVFIGRVSNRVAYVEHLLEQEFDFSKEERWEWDRKKAERPADESEWDDLWRRRIKNEYLGRMIRKELDRREQIKKAEAAESSEAIEAAESSAAAEGLQESEAAEALEAPASAEGPDSGSGASDPEEAPVSPEEYIRKYYSQFLNILLQNDREWLVERYLNAYAGVYDPHTTYMAPSTIEDFNISMRLSLVGIGAVLRSDEGAAKIMQLIAGGPAERGGKLKVGDKIIAVAQDEEEPVSVLHWPLTKTVRLIRGEKGTRVVLTVIPAEDVSGTRTRRVALVRDEVKLEEQAAKAKLQETEADGHPYRIGVITLPDFYLDMEAAQHDPDSARSSFRDVRRLLDQMLAEGAQGMVLDLRNNGGGSLTEAINITGLFIAAGPVVQVKRDRWGSEAMSDPDPLVAFEGPLVVLVNRLSASASEILAAALQDYGRAVIVGDRKTHGKGTVQRVVPLQGEQSGALKVTLEKFYRISGDSTQIKGVEPDIVIPSPFDVMEIGEETLPHAMEWTSIGRAFYRKNTRLKEQLPELLRRSTLRRETDEALRDYLLRIERNRRYFEEKSVPLQFDERLRLAEEEQEFDELLTGASGVEEAATESGQEEDEDPVLDEALKIAADMLALREARIAARTAAP